jgi:glycoprotein 6-alpha-L-fucosyltransferase
MVVINVNFRFPNYEIHADNRIAKSAQEKSRFTEESLRGIFADVKVLSKCDFVVCTLSSNVGRLIYEFLQIEKGDAAHDLYSLDFPYGNHRQFSIFLSRFN